MLRWTCTWWAIKTCRFVFDYHCGVLTIVTLFGWVKTRINTLHLADLMAWRQYSCVTLHVTEFYLLELFLRIKCATFRRQFWFRNCGNVNDSFREYRRNLNKNWKRWTLDHFLQNCKLPNQFGRLHSRKRSGTVVLNCG